MRALRAALVLGIVLVLAALAFAALTKDNGRPVATTAGFGRGLSNVSVGTSTKIRMSPDAEMVALVERGTVTVVRSRDGSRVMSAGKNVVDVAWMPDGKRVIVVEGPIPTGEVAAVDLRGHTAGVAKLNPSIGFGAGLGLTTDDRGTRAAAISVTHDVIGGGVHTDVAVVDLQTGVTRTLATATDERRPVFVDDNTVGAVVTSAATGRDDFVVGEISGGAAIRKAATDVVAGPFIANTSGEVVLAVDRPSPVLVALTPATGSIRVLAHLRRGRVPVDVDARLSRMLVRVTDKDGTVHLSFDALSTRGSAP